MKKSKSSPVRFAGASPNSKAGELYSRKQVAQRLKVCPHTIARYSRLGLLPCLRINRRLVRYREEDIQSFIQAAVA